MKLLKIFSVIVLALSSIALAKSDITSNPNSIGADNLSFVISAAEGKLSPLKSGSYQLLLNGVSPYTVYYTRRPNRDSGLASMANFVKSWGVGTHSFAQDNPNAALSASNINGVANNQGLVKIFQLSHPTYNIARGTLTLVATPIGNNNQIVIKNEVLRGVSLLIN